MLRVFTACDACKAARRKCDGKANCEGCARRSIPCSYTANKKRGPQSSKLSRRMDAYSRKVDETGECNESGSILSLAERGLLRRFFELVNPVFFIVDETVFYSALDGLGASCDREHPSSAAEEKDAEGVEDSAGLASGSSVLACAFMILSVCTKLQGDERGAVRYYERARDLLDAAMRCEPSGHLVSALLVMLYLPPTAIGPGQALMHVSLAHRLAEALPGVSTHMRFASSGLRYFHACTTGDVLWPPPQPAIGTHPLARFIDLVTFMDVQLVQGFADVTPELVVRGVPRAAAASTCPQPPLPLPTVRAQPAFVRLIDEAVAFQEHAGFSYLASLLAAKALLGARDAGPSGAAQTLKFATASLHAFAAYPTEMTRIAGTYALSRLLLTVVPFARGGIEQACDGDLRAAAGDFCVAAIRAMTDPACMLTSGPMATTFTALRRELEVLVGPGTVLAPLPWRQAAAAAAAAAHAHADEETRRAVAAVFAQVLLELHVASPRLGASALSPPPLPPADRLQSVNIFHVLRRAHEIVRGRIGSIDVLPSFALTVLRDEDETATQRGETASLKRPRMASGGGKMGAAAVAAAHLASLTLQDVTSRPPFEEDSPAAGPCVLADSTGVRSGALLLPWSAEVEGGGGSWPGHGSHGAEGLAFDCGVVGGGLEPPPFSGLDGDLGTLLQSVGATGACAGVPPSPLPAIGGAMQRGFDEDWGALLRGADEAGWG